MGTEAEIAKYLFDRWGAWGVLTAYILWKETAPWRKKRSGSYVSWEFLQARGDNLEKKLTAHQDLDFSKHAEFATAIGELKVMVTANEKNTDRLVNALESIQRDLSDLKNIIIEKQK